MSDCQVSYYDMHDGKMIYMLTQHSLYNRKFHHFLLCACHRGDGVINGDHKCKLLSHNEKIRLFSRSEKKWKRKMTPMSIEYTHAKHMDWVDSDNKGVSHFGLHPSKLRYGNIQFDVFHLCSAVTCRLMTYLCTFMLSQTFEVMNKFSSQVLSKFWGDYQVLVWNLNKYFSSFIGKDIKQFIKNIPNVLEFIDINFEDTEHLDNLCTSVGIWYKINPFLNKMKVSDATKMNVSYWNLKFL